MRQPVVRLPNHYLAACVSLFASAGAFADTTPQSLPFNQNWSNSALITTANTWTGVPGIIGANGTNTASSVTGVDPQTLIFEDPTPTLSVNANQTVVMSTMLSGEVAEFETPGVVAFQGSGTADAPYLLITINTTGRASIPMSYSLRDIDDGVESAIQAVALQYRIGTTGTFTNIPAAFVADASTGPSLATLVTPVSVTLPAALDNQPVVQLRIITSNAVGSDEFIGVDDISIGGSATDVPPTVSSTTPANNAVNVLIDSNINVAFSEAVTVSGNWYTLNCATSGAHTAVVTGGPGTYILDPSPNFAFNESCTLVIIAANVLDQDGTPEAMASDVTVNFTTVADVAPTVSSTVPANNATGVNINANVTVNFNEPVTVNGAWYSLSCAVSGNNLAATVTGGPTSYLIDPTATLANDELCTLTVNAANVLDQDGTPNAMAANFSSSFRTQPSVANYYNSVDASTATTLRATLHPVIRGHTCYFYTGAGTSVWTILEDADQAPGVGNENKVLDVYKNEFYTKGTDRAGVNNNPVTSFNREHTWPNSYGFNDVLTAPGNGGTQFPYCPYTDTHMLYVSNVAYNSSRGNLRYDNCAGCGELATTANAGQGGAGFPNRLDGTQFETWDLRKGDMARAILYMDIRYEGGTHPVTGISEPNLIATNETNLIVTTPNNQIVPTGYMGRLATLIAWHQADPPTDAERARNDKIFGYQNNRNPFIDRPEWVNCLYLNQCGSTNEILFKDGFETLVP
jgi:endonuclease I